MDTSGKRLLLLTVHVLNNPRFRAVVSADLANGASRGRPTNKISGWFQVLL